MLTYEEMQYYAAFAECGTLTEVAERYHISQPTITRAMKKAEDVFNVPLFDRTKNSIRLNDNGKMPAELEEGLNNNTYQLIILPYDISQEEKNKGLYYAEKIGEEHLMFLLPKKHKFARRKSLKLAEMNGENMLLFARIGFWEDIVRKKMPDSRFLVQDERYSFSELVANSVLPCFTTDLASHLSNEVYKERVAVPISDPEVNVSYYLVCKRDRRDYFAGVFTTH